MLAEYFLKILYRIVGIIKMFGWKVLYNSRFKIGKKTFFYPKCRILIEHTGKIKIGNNCFFNKGCSFTSMGDIQIGDDCIFGEDVKIYDHNHNFKDDSSLFRKQGYSIGTVKIGNNVWIGSNVLILPNVTIGNNVVIAAGSIVSKSVQNNTVLIQKR